MIHEYVTLIGTVKIQQVLPNAGKPAKEVTAYRNDLSISLNPVITQKSKDLKLALLSGKYSIARADRLPCRIPPFISEGEIFNYKKKKKELDKSKLLLPHQS